MRLLRGLCHLVLALALTVAMVAQASTIERTRSAMSHPAGDRAVWEMAHDCGTADAQQPVHSPDGCQMACCFVPAQLPARMAEGNVLRFATVRYRDVVKPLYGRAYSPEPGIPKHIA